MDFPLNSSLILAITVGLWLLWVAPYVFRRSNTALMPATAVHSVMSLPPSPAIRSSISADGLSQQGNTMYNNSVSQSASAAPRSAAPRSVGAGQAPAAAQAKVQVQAPDFRIRYGRTALALVGALSLAAVVIGMPLAAFGAASWWLPTSALVTVAASTFFLRTLAVRDRRRRVNAAFRAAMSSGRESLQVPAPRPTPEQQSAPAEPVRQRETVLFDRESRPGVTAEPAVEAAIATAPGSPDRRLTAAELRAAALQSASASEPAAPSGPPKTSTTPWQPVELPKPTYVDAAVAQRPVPEPLVPPQTPKPTARTSIRAGAVAAAADAAESAGSEQGAGKINLDDVLQRRRA